MEIGSFIEMAFPKGKEWHSAQQDIARLNTGRAAIYHSVRVLGCNTVYLPLYQCETVEAFLHRKGCEVKTYLQDENFDPLLSKIEKDACIVLVNYFGIMGTARMKELSKRYSNVIIDNSQAFFAPPISEAMNVYSARKFVGVPDGAYVIGKNAKRYLSEYEQGYSSDTSLFLLQRIEYGCEGKTYQNRTKNEDRIDSEDIKRMSRLTHTILDGTDYEYIIQKRKDNFSIASKLFGEVNGINPQMYYASDCVPMVYPLYVEDDALLSRLLEAKHFQGHWWNYILERSEPDAFEYRMSRYMIPITIDQRYGEKELCYLRGLV